MTDFNPQGNTQTSGFLSQGPNHSREVLIVDESKHEKSTTSFLPDINIRKNNVSGDYEHVQTQAHLASIDKSLTPDNDGSGEFEYEPMHK